MAYDPKTDPNNSEYDPDYVASQQAPPAVRGPADPRPDPVWQDYAHAAIRARYPHLREGVDYFWGRKDADSPAEMLYWNEDLFPAADLGSIEEIATKLMERDPYASKEPPKPGLHRGSVLGEGEVPKGERAQDQPGV